MLSWGWEPPSKNASRKDLKLLIMEMTNTKKKSRHHERQRNAKQHRFFYRPPSTLAAS